MSQFLNSVGVADMPVSVCHGEYKDSATRSRPSLAIGAFTVATMLFFVLSPSVLQLLNWNYLGGGGEYQKIHIATYLLIAAFTWLWLIDPRFRGNVVTLCTDLTLISFALSVGVFAFYAVLVKHVSIAPFVDTFLAALLVTIGWICLPPESLRRLRYLIDIFFVINIALLFFEYATKSWLVFSSFGGPFRAVAFFENPLSAATLLGVYAMANLVATPIRFRRESLIRLILGFVSLAAVLTTGGRAALAITMLILFVFAVVTAIRQFASGRINRAAVVYGILGAPVAAAAVVALLQFGLFDTMLSRFEFDNGSALSRQVAFDLASAMPSNDVLLGLPRNDVSALTERQEEMNLVAIEISWINFLLIGGWLLTVPLFVTYSLFLLRFVPRQCVAQAILPSIFLLIITAASNGIWAKTLVLTTSLAIILAFFRKPFPVHHRLGRVP